MDDSKPSVRPLQIATYLAQPANPRASEGKVELCDMALTARIPTQFKGDYLVYEIMGRQGKALIVSPTGGIAQKNYFKPVSQLREDKGNRGSFSGERGTPEYAKHTEEDTERFWLLSNPQFREELAAQGWMVFPEIEKVDRHAQKVIMSNSSDRLYKRDFKLSDFIRVLELTTSKDNDKIDYTLNIRDLQELNRFGNDISYFWEADSNVYGSFFSMVAKRNEKDSGLVVKLSDRDSFQRSSHANPKPMQREVLVETELPQNGEETTMVFEYAKEQGIDARWGHRGDRGMVVSVFDKEYDKPVETPDTKAALDKAWDLKAFADKVLEQRAKSIEATRLKKLNAKRLAAGLPIKQPGN